jgi:hypothetical protein
MPARALRGILAAVTVTTLAGCADPAACPEAPGGAAQQLDLVLVIDVSRSMGGQLDVFKQGMPGLIEQLTQRGIDVRMAAFTITDRSPYQDHLAFTGDMPAFTKWVSELYLMDSGDEPENSLDAIHSALALEFRPEARRMLLLVTDARPHERQASGEGPARHTLAETAEALFKGDHRVEALFSAPVTQFAAFAAPVGWPFDRDRLVYEWLALQQGVYFFDPPPATFDQWVRARTRLLAEEFPLGPPEWKVREQGTIRYEDWLLLQAALAQPGSDAENLGLQFLNDPAKAVSPFWTGFFATYGVQGRCLLQRAIALGYSFRSESYTWGAMSVDQEGRRIGFETAEGLYEALVDAVNAEGMSAGEWQIFDELYFARLESLKRTNPALRLGHVLANRDDYPELAPATLKADVVEIRKYGEFYDGVQEAGLEEELAEARAKGWTVKARPHRFWDWEIDNDDKVIYIADDEFDRASGPKHLREALAEVRSYFSEADMMQKYAQIYRGDAEAERYFLMMMAGEYRVAPGKSTAIDREGKTITIERTLSPEDAARALRGALEEVHGLTASRFIQGAGKGITTMGALLDLSDAELEALGAKEVADRFRRDLAIGSENAGSLQDFVSDELRNEALFAAGGFVLTRAPYLLNALRSNRLRPNAVTHLAHSELVDRATGQVLWRAGRAVTEKITRDVDDLTELLREVAEEAIGDVYYSRALPRRAGGRAYRQGLEGNLRVYINHELKRSPANWTPRPAHVVGNAYHQQFSNILNERLRSDPRFKRFQGRLSVNQAVDGIPGRPDVTLDVGDGRRAIWDLTTSWEAATLAEDVVSERGKVRRLRSYLPKISKYVSEGAAERVTHLIDIPYFPSTYRERW